MKHLPKDCTIFGGAGRLGVPCPNKHRCPLCSGNDHEVAGPVHWRAMDFSSRFGFAYLIEF